MIRVVSFLFSVCLSLNVLIGWADFGLAQAVFYDCPAVATARSVSAESQNRWIEIELPVSMTIGDSKLEIDQFKIEIRWNRNPHPVVDFAPRTSMWSKIDGPVSIEKSSETTVGVGAKTSSDYLEFLTPTLSGDVTKRNAETRRYAEIPEQEVLIASGTLDRSTGVYFQIKRSRLQTLEGSRELLVVFEVPQTWRGGVLQATMTTVGNRKKFAGFTEAFDYSRVFIMPVYLRGDDQARELAEHFANSEQRLRADWQQFETANEKATTAYPFARVFGSKSETVPNMWVHHLIQSRTDMAIDHYENQLPPTITDAAHEFVEARKNLLAIGR